MMRGSLPNPKRQDEKRHQRQHRCRHQKKDIGRHDFLDEGKLGDDGGKDEPDRRRRWQSRRTAHRAWSEDAAR